MFCSAWLFSQVASASALTCWVTTSKPTSEFESEVAGASTFAFLLGFAGALEVTGEFVEAGQAANNLGRSAENSSASSTACTTLASYSRFA